MDEQVESSLEPVLDPLWYTSDTATREIWSFLPRQRLQALLVEQHDLDEVSQEALMVQHQVDVGARHHPV